MFRTPAYAPGGYLFTISNYVAGGGSAVIFITGNIDFQAKILHIHYAIITGITPFEMDSSKILMIVDDQEFDRNFFCHAVKKIDPAWKCLTASSSAEAIKVLETAVQLPDYIFLDVNMPGMDGIECLAAIKTSAAWVEIPVIICSGSISQQHLLLTEALGAAYYMVKQSNIDNLPAEIRFAIAKTDEEIKFLKIESDNKKAKNS